jgi:hypothetical protein
VVAGGGFVPQSPTDSLELADSTMVRNAKNGYKGNFFIQFSFSFASVGVGHDLRAAVDSSKGGFGTPEAADENKIWLSVSFGSAAPVFNRENRYCRPDGCRREGKSRHLDPSWYSDVMSFDIPNFSLSSCPY